jgi:hypothetical protein
VNARAANKNLPVMEIKMKSRQPSAKTGRGQSFIGVNPKTVI